MLSTTAAAVARTLARWALIPLLGVALGLGAAWAVTSALTPTYRATGSVVVVPNQQRKAADDTGLTDVSLALNLSPSVARLAESREVATSVATKLKVPEEDVLGAVTATSEPGSQIVTVQVESSTAAGAARIADAVTKATTSLYGTLKLGGRSGVTVRVLDAAGVPVRATSPRPLLNAALGALVGLLVGVGVVTLRVRSDDRFRSVREVEKRLGLPTLGRIRALPRWRRSAARTYEVGRVRRAIEATAAAVGVYAGGRTPTTILVTAAGPDTPVPMVAALLTHGLAVGGRRAVVLDAFARRSGVDDVVGPRFGTTVEALLDPAHDATPARMLTSSALIDHLGTLDATRVAGLLAPVAARTDVVVVAAPPVLAGESLPALAAHADVVLLVLDADRVSEAEAARAGMLVNALDVSLAGVLLLGAAVDRDGAQPAVWRSTRRAPARRAAIAPVPAAVPAPVVVVPEPVAAPTTNGHTHGHSNGHTNGNGHRGGRHAAVAPYLTPILVETKINGGPRRLRVSP